MICIIYLMLPGWEPHNLHDLAHVSWLGYMAVAAEAAAAAAAAFLSSQPKYGISSYQILVVSDGL